MAQHSEHGTDTSKRREPSQLSDRGARTRARLITTARQTFAKHGYFDTKLTDITTAAGMAAGTFYTYFDNREQVLAAIMAEAYHESVEPATARPATEGDPLSRIRHGNRHYVESFRTTADVQRIIQEAALVDKDARLLRRSRADSLFDRNAQTIAQLQEAGRIDQSLEPESTARNLSLMVSRTCTYMYVEGHAGQRYSGRRGARRLADELSDTWLRTLGADPATVA